MTTALRVALLGFSAFERSAIASYFRLAVRRTPSYELVAAPSDSDYIVADSDHSPSVQLVLVLERMPDTVFVGQQAPAGAMAWMARPIDTLHVMRELDALGVAQRAALPKPAAAPATPGSRTVIQPLRRPRDMLPAAAAATQISAPPPAPVPVPAQPSALLVDDSDIALHFLRNRLQRWGVDVECVGTSRKAIDCLARRGFDLVFLDVELGRASELDGLGLCQHIKRQHRPVGGVNSTVVMVSAHHSELDRVRGTLAGCDAYLGKPLDEGELGKLLLRQGIKPRPSNDATPTP